MCRPILLVAMFRFCQCPSCALRGAVSGCQAPTSPATVSAVPFSGGGSTPVLRPHDAALLELQAALAGSRLAGGLDAGRAGPATGFSVPGPGLHAVPLPLVMTMPVLTWLRWQPVCSFQVTCGENPRTT